MYSSMSASLWVGFLVCANSERIFAAWNALPVTPVIPDRLEPLAEPGGIIGFWLFFFFLSTTTRHVR